MKLTILGSCSGTETMPKRHHTAVMAEVDGRNYLIDAGDGCGYSAHLLGFDLPALSAVFITHTHIDHVGGVPYLMFNILKLRKRRQLGPGEPIPYYAPDDRALQAGDLLLRKGAAEMFVYHGVEDGVLFDDGHLKVRALHNRHLRETEAPWHSFSFCLEADGMRVTLSGDLADVSEIVPFADCDVMLLESGHHSPPASAAYLAALEKHPPRLVFYHHGREMLADPVGVTAQAAAYYDGEVLSAYDGMCIEI